MWKEFKDIWKIVLICLTAWLILRGIGTLLPEVKAVENTATVEQTEDNCLTTCINQCK